MKEKINLSSKIKERVLIKNISLNSLEKLPPKIYGNISDFKHNFLVIYGSNIHRPEIKIIDAKSILIPKNKSLPDFKSGELILLILPLGDIRYVFICKVRESQDNGYVLEILDPRTDERLEIKTKVPVFLSLIPETYIREILQNHEYTLLKEINTSEDNYLSLSEVHFYDLVLNSNHNIDDRFKKLIQKTFLVGELINISKGGMAVKVPSYPGIQDEFQIFYSKFNLISPSRVIKMALFSHLRGLTQVENGVMLHFAFLSGLRETLWNLLKNDIEKLNPL